MTNVVNLLSVDSHFRFGKNWASYAELITEAQISEAAAALERLGATSFEGRRILDLGCGSGLHALAALRLGAREVVAIDIDPDSVVTTRALLEGRAPDGPWSVGEASIFNFDPAVVGQFDVVYSWGVLHHTGDMSRALACAAALVAPGGKFCFALYRRTLMCGLWKFEKRWYTRASARAQLRALTIYVMMFRFGLTLSGRNFEQYVEGYKRHRGMDFYHDVHDWVGGWPYESTTVAAVDKMMRKVGLSKICAIGPTGIGFGIAGTGCNEYVYQRLQ